MRRTIVVSYDKDLDSDFIDIIEKDLNGEGNLVIRCDNQSSITSVDHAVISNLNNDTNLIWITAHDRLIPYAVKVAIKKKIPIIPVKYCLDNIPLFAAGCVVVHAPPMSEVIENEYSYTQFFTNLLHQLESPGSQYYEGDLPKPEVLRRELHPDELISKLHSIGFPSVSRKWLTDAVQKWIDDSESAQTLIIAGSPGSGKTLLTTELLLSGLPVKACYWCKESASVEHNLIQIIKNISYQIAMQSQEYLDYLIDAKPKRALVASGNIDQVFEELIAFPLQQVVLPENVPIVILIDGIDHAYKEDDRQVPQFIDQYLRSLPHNVRIILTIRSDAPLLSTLSPQDRATYHLHMGKQLSDIKQFITTQKDWWKSYIGSKNAELLSQVLLRHNNGSFRYVAAISDAVYAGYYTFLPKQEYLFREQLTIDAIEPPQDIMQTLEKYSIWHLLSVPSSGQQKMIQFIEKNINLLKTSDSSWSAEKVLVQLASELAEKDPVRIETKEWLQQRTPAWAWLRCEQKHNGFVNEEYSILTGHRGTVIGAIYTDNGYIFSWSEDDPFLRVWDTRGKVLGVLSGHSSEICECLHIRDQHNLSWSSDGTICIWDENLNLRTTFSAVHTRVMTGVAYLESDVCITWGTDGVIQFWSATGVYLRQIQAHEFSVLGVLEMGNGILVSIGSDLSISILSSEGEMLHQMRSHAASKSEIPLEINPFRRLHRSRYSAGLTGLIKLSDDRFVSWGGTAVVEVFDAPRIWSTDGELIALLDGHTRPINNVLVLSDSSILTCSLDGTMRLWTRDGVLLHVLAEHEDPIAGVLETRDGSLLSWSWDCTVRRWSLSGEYKGIVATHSSRVSDLWEVRKGEILSVDSNGEYKLWSLSESFSNTLAATKLHSNFALPLPNWNILSWGYDNSLYLWNIEVENEYKIQGHEDFIAGALFDRDSNRIISWGASPQLCFWDADGNLVSKSNETDDFLFESCDLLQLHDGRMVTYGSIPNIALWSAEGEVITFLKGHEDEILEVQELASGKLISRSSDFTLILWSSEGKLDKRMDEHISPPIGMYEFEDGTILSWDRDKLFCIWSNTGKLLSKLSNVEAIVRYPSIQKVIDAVPEENYGFDYAHKTLILRNKANGNEARWISNENVTAHQALADGRVLVSFDTGDIGILQLYKGNRPVSLKEFLSI